MRKLIALLVVVVIVVAGWTGAWFWARSMLLERMDEAMADMAEKGVTVTCPDRSASGWPFRMEVTCAAPALTLADGTTMKVAALAAVWHIVNPKLVVMSALSPLTAEVPRGSASLAFDTLRASFRTNDLATGQVSMESDKPVLSIADAAGTSEFRADRGEIHVRPTAGQVDSWDLAATTLGFNGTTAGAALLPAPSNAGLDLSVSQVDSLRGPGQPLAAWAAAGGKVSLHEAALEVGEARIAAKGTGSLDPEGAAYASLDATATKIAWLTGAAREGKPLPPILAALGSAFLLIGRPLDGEGSPRALTIAVEAGAVTANGLPIAKIPALFAAGS